MLCSSIRAGLRLGHPWSVSSLLNEEGRKRERPTEAQDLTGGGPPQNFSTVLPRGMDRLLAPRHPSHMARWTEWTEKGAACMGTAMPLGFGQLMCPLKGWLCADKGSQNTPVGAKVNWQISSLPPCLVWESLTGLRWRVLLMAPPLPGHGDRR